MDSEWSSQWYSLTWHDPWYGWCMNYCQLKVAGLDQQQNHVRFLHCSIVLLLQIWFRVWRMFTATWWQLMKAGEDRLSCQVDMISSHQHHHHLAQLQIVLFQLMDLIPWVHCLLLKSNAWFHFPGLPWQESIIRLIFLSLVLHWNCVIWWPWEKT